MADENNAERTSDLSPSKKRQRRNKRYYEKNKDSFRTNKCSYHFKMELPKEDERRLTEIKAKIENAKERLKQRTGKTTNVDLLEALLDSWLDTSSPEDISTSPSDPMQFLSSISDSSFGSTATIPSSLVNPKVQLHSACKENDEIYLVCETALERLFKYFVESGNVCSCGRKLDLSSIKIARVTKHSHCVKVVVGCDKKHVTEWFSSSIMSSHSAGKYYVNVRMVHGFTSVGMLPSQYEGLCQAAKLGFVNEHYVADVYNSMKYIEAVQGMTDYECSGIIEEIKGTDSYKQNGEGVMLDARYDSVRTAYHTTVSAISMTNHKVIGVTNCSRADIASAQAREKPMSLTLIDNLKEELNIAEVSHDTVIAIKNDLVSRGITNSFDTWHGGKSVKKALAKVAKGTLKNEGKTWFCELSDKVKSVKTHFYYAMKNCNNDSEELQKSLKNIVEHYKGNHAKCNEESRCRTQDDYVPTKRIIKSPAAAKALMDTITSTSIYKNAKDFATCRDTYYIESFHNAILVYAPKRIHFSDSVYNMRINTAILDWNENVDRDVYCAKFYQSIKRPDRVAPYRILKPKTFHFRDNIWSSFYSINW